MTFARAIAAMILASLAFTAGCGKKAPDAPAEAKPAKHEHHPPHGGTPVVLGDEAYHLELVRSADTGTLEAYVLDGEMENFIRSAMPSIEIIATVDGKPQSLTLKAVANAATGETVGDTSLFQTQADWLKGTPTFDGILKSITIRGSTFSDVSFNFPKGNDKD